MKNLKSLLKNLGSKIKEKYNNILDFMVLKEENKLLKKRIEELERQQIPLIDLKNKYLSDLRVKNLELGRLKKRYNIDE